MGTRKSIANFDFRSCVEEIETAPAQQCGIIFKPNSPVPEGMRLPAVQVLRQCRQSLLSRRGHAGDEPHHLGIGTNQEKIVEVLEGEQSQMQPWGFNLDFDAVTS